MESSVYESVIRIGQKLFAESDMASLCEMIIDEAQKITHAEGGTLYLSDQQPPKQLNFSIVHNQALDQYDTHQGTRVSTLRPIPLFDETGQANQRHIAASAAHRREIINIADTYTTSEYDFSGAHNFDRQAKYHTQSVLAIPLINDASELIGVLQLINARDDSLNRVIPFSTDLEPITAMLASFAALAISAQNASNRNRELLIKLSGQSNTQALMESILVEAQKLTRAEGGSLYLLEGDHLDRRLRFMIVRNDVLKISYGGLKGEPVPYPAIPLFQEEEGSTVANIHNVVTYCAHKREVVIIDDAYTNQQFDLSGTRRFDEQNGYQSRSFLTIPLLDHNKDVIGVLQLVNATDMLTHEVVPFPQRIVPLVKALATYAAIALENQLLVQEHKELLDTFIQCIAKAIDAKSAHTSGHCQRVPLLTELIAKAACEDYQRFATFHLDEDGWYELHVAAWLHDCGKLATPDSVLDKATKLSGLKDGMELVNARFAALKQQAKNECLKKIFDAPQEIESLKQWLRDELEVIESERLFLERANRGGEFFSDEDKARVQSISKRQWVDHAGSLQPILTEGEILNLCVSRGTLNEHERQIINSHIQVTIDMLESLKFPRKLQRVPEYAGGHHEKMDGTGFPRGLTRKQMSVPARIMAIADIFEALTSRDRPYKEPMRLSQALSIMQRMKKDHHIDPDLYALFIEAGVWRAYAEQVLLPQQLDVQDALIYL